MPVRRREASGAGQGGPSDRRQGWPGAGVPGAADVGAAHLRLFLVPRLRTVHGAERDVR